MKKPNAFDADFREDLLDIGATLDEKVECVFEQLAKMPPLRKAVQDAIESYRTDMKNPGYAGPGLSQRVRKNLAEAMNGGGHLAVG